MLILVRWRCERGTLLALAHSLCLCLHKCILCRMETGHWWGTVGDWEGYACLQIVTCAPLSCWLLLAGEITVLLTLTTACFCFGSPAAKGCAVQRLALGDGRDLAPLIGL